jgi:hypothetical protein
MATLHRTGVGAALSSVCEATGCRQGPRGGVAHEQEADTRSTHPQTAWAEKTPARRAAGRCDADLTCSKCPVLDLRFSWARSLLFEIMLGLPLVCFCLLLRTLLGFASPQRARQLGACSLSPFSILDRCRAHTLCPGRCGRLERVSGCCKYETPACRLALPATSCLPHAAHHRPSAPIRHDAVIADNLSPPPASVRPHLPLVFRAYIDSAQLRARSESISPCVPPYRPPGGPGAVAAAMAS